MATSTDPVEVYGDEPDDFSPQVDVAACYLEVDGKFLLLQLSEYKDEHGRWGVPAGKVLPGEPLEVALRRELHEETGIQLDDDVAVDFLVSLYVRRPGFDFIYHEFRVILDAIPEVALSREHSSYRWVTVAEAQQMDLVTGGQEVLYGNWGRRDA